MLSVLPQASQKRREAAIIFDRLSTNRELAKKFFELKKGQVLTNALNRIENFNGSDSIWDDFAIMTQKDGTVEAKDLTASMQDDDLIFAIIELDKAVEEAENSLNFNNMTQSSIFEPSSGAEVVMQPSTDMDVLLQSTVAGIAQPTEQGIKSIKKDSLPTDPNELITYQVNIIKSWPEEAKNEKITALQLLAAYHYNERYGHEGIMKFASVIRIFRALLDLRSTIPSVRERPLNRFAQVLSQRAYNIHLLGYVSDKQLKDYFQSGKGDILRGFCNNLQNLQKTVKKYEDNTQKFKQQNAKKLYERYKNSYQLCGYIQGKHKNEKVKARLLIIIPIL